MKNDSSSDISPRFAAALFFAIYALLFLVFTLYTLLSLKDSAGFPVGISFILIPLLGACLGAIFGQKMGQGRTAWWIIVLWSILMSLMAIAILSSAAFINSLVYDPSFLQRLHSFLDFLVIFALFFTYIFLIIGVWLIPLSAVAAMYFNRRFYPGLVAVDKLRQQKQDVATKND